MKRAIAPGSALSNVGVSAAARALVAISNLAFLGVLARRVDLADFGLWNVCWSMAVGVAFLLEGGLATALISDIPRKSPIAWYSILREPKLSIGITGLLLAVLLGGWLAFVNASRVVFVVALLVAAMILQRISADVARIDGMFGWSSFNEGAIASLSGLVTVFLFKDPSLSDAACGYSVAGVAYSILFILGREVARRRRGSGAAAGVQLVGRTALVVTDLARYATTQADVLLCAAIVGPAATGIYGAGKRLSTAVGSVQAVVAGVARGRLSVLARSRRHMEVRREMRVLAIISTTVVTPLMVGVGILGVPIVTSIFGPGFAESAQVVLVLLGAQVVAAATGPAGTYLALNPRLRRKLAATTVVGSAVGVATMGVLALAEGAVGVAFGAAMGVILTNALQWRCARLSLQGYIHPRSGGVVSDIEGRSATAVNVSAQERTVHR